MDSDLQQSDSGIQAVRMTLEILEYIASQRIPVGVTDVGRSLGVTKSRIHRHLQTLVSMGYIVQSEESTKYSVGPRLVTIGLSAFSNLDLVAIGRDMARDLRDDLGHSTVLSQVDLDGVRVLLALPGRSAYSIRIKPGTLLGSDTSAQGKVALAYGGISGKIPSDDTELVKIRQQGWASEHNAVGVNILAAPVFDRRGAIVGTLAIMDFPASIGATPTPAQLSGLTGASARISSALGYSPK